MHPSGRTHAVLVPLKLTVNMPVIDARDISLLLEHTTFGAVGHSLHAQQHANKRSTFCVVQLVPEDLLFMDSHLSMYAQRVESESD